MKKTLLSGAKVQLADIRADLQCICKTYYRFGNQNENKDLPHKLIPSGVTRVILFTCIGNHFSFGKCLNILVVSRNTDKLSTTLMIKRQISSL